MIKNLLFFVACLTFANSSFADIQKKIIYKLTGTKTLSFDFKQVITDNIEVGNCFVKYPLLMKCNYQNKKQKIIISNGKTLAIIKKKYKKIYLYPIKSTPLFYILKKEEIIKLIRNNKPKKINSDIIEFRFNDKKNRNLKLFFDNSTFNLIGWETVDAYANKVVFVINNLKINKQIPDSLFKIPSENEL